MTADDVIAALDLPPTARVDRRVPKTLLLDHGAPTAADKRHINGGIEQIQWVAALKPTTIGVAAHRDDVREYLEIAVLRVALRADAKSPRLIELLHRAVPYPMLAVTELDDRVNLSLAHKRWSQGEAGKTVLEGEPVVVDCPCDEDPHGPALLGALALGRQPQASLLTLYQGWVDVLLALDAARRTGRFEILGIAERRAARREALRDCARLDAEMARLRTAAAKERQMARQVELNLELKRAEVARKAALAQL
ncbi:MAG: DUF4391 domain-containing protein [Chromatiales bacterium]|nr:DUF4391 domain-containing protein [Chromatiales bacterium]